MPGQKISGGLRLHLYPFKVPEVRGHSGEVINRNARLDDVRAVVGIGLGSGGIADDDDGLHGVDLLAFDVFIITYVHQDVKRFKC